MGAVLVRYSGGGGPRAYWGVIRSREAPSNNALQLTWHSTFQYGNSLLYCPPPIPKPDPCPTDTNDDGVTNVLDLIQLLLAFGQACP